MDIFELLLIAVGLSMDAFAVSIMGTTSSPVPGSAAFRR